jgi:hypothetical protein
VGRGSRDRQCRHQPPSARGTSEGRRSARIPQNLAASTRHGPSPCNNRTARQPSKGKGEQQEAGGEPVADLLTHPERQVPLISSRPTSCNCGPPSEFRSTATSPARLPQEARCPSSDTTRPTCTPRGTPQPARHVLHRRAARRRPRPRGLGVPVTEARPDRPATPREPKSPSMTPSCESAESDQWAFMTALPPHARLFLAVGNVPSEVSHALKRCSSICLSCARSGTTSSRPFALTLVVPDPRPRSVRRVLLVRWPIRPKVTGRQRRGKAVEHL